MFAYHTALTEKQLELEWMKDLFAANTSHYVDPLAVVA